MKRTLATMAALLLLSSLAACGGDASEAAPETFAVSGNLTLSDGPTSSYACLGQGGYSDIHRGAQVVVRDGTGKSVGIGELGGGVGSFPDCVYSFAVSDVPSGGGIYSVEVTSRGEISFKESEAEGLSITLGD